MTTRMTMIGPIAITSGLLMLSMIACEGRREPSEAPLTEAEETPAGPEAAAGGPGGAPAGPLGGGEPVPQAGPGSPVTAGDPAGYSPPPEKPVAAVEAGEPQGGAADAEQEVTTSVELIDSQGKRIGQLALQETAQGVAIRIEASGLPPGKHGFHIHETGKCETPDFKSAGGHFNPTGKEHGFENPKGSHAGDLPNLEAKEDGTVQTTVTADDVTLRDGESSLTTGDGTAIVVHAEPDDLETDPTGNSGDRIACAVISS